MTRLSKNFTLNEFTKSDTATRLKIDNSLPCNGEDLCIKNLAVYLLQPLRNKFGRMTITSGYRCPELNKAVGGVSNSRHTKGNAADIYFQDAKLNDVWGYLKENPDNLKWRQCLLYGQKNFIHFDFDAVDHKMEMIVKN